MDSLESAGDEYYAVFLGKRPHEERVTHFANYQWREHLEQGGQRFRTKWKPGWSSVSDPTGKPRVNAHREDFVGMRPVAMPREVFAKAIGLSELDSKRYLAEVTDDWSVAEVDDDEG